MLETTNWPDWSIFHGFCVMDAVTHDQSHLWTLQPLNHRCTPHHRPVEHWTMEFSLFASHSFQDAHGPDMDIFRPRTDAAQPKLTRTRPGLRFCPFMDLPDHDISETIDMLQTGFLDNLRISTGSALLILLGMDQHLRQLLQPWPHSLNWIFDLFPLFPILPGCDLVFHGFLSTGHFSTGSMPVRDVMLFPWVPTWNTNMETLSLVCENSLRNTCDR